MGSQGVATYDFFEDGLLKQTDYGNGLKETRTYDAAGRLETLSVDKVGQAVSRFEYGDDANGNRVSQVETRGLAGETTTYGYDEADRLIGVEYPAETHLYQVDAVGNRTGEKRAASGVVAALTVAAFAALSPTVASAAVERQHNAVDWVTAVVDVKASTTTVLTYDANGNRTTEGTKTYSWDIRDTLTRVEDGSTVVGTYDYDAKLQRVKADTVQGHVEYVLDGKYVLREAGARSRRYHFGEGEALAVTGVGGAAGQDRWLLTDALGSVVTEADATAMSVTARQFDAWGNYRNNTAPTANETRLGYTGHQFDFETGLTYARARYYDSKLGVFLSRDSFEGVIGDAPSLHRFAYTHNNPLRYRDPSGRRLDHDMPFYDPALKQARADCRAGDCQEYDNASWLTNQIGTGVAIGMGVAAATAVAVETGVAAGLVDGVVGLGRAAVWTTRTIATGFKVGAPGVGLSLAGETALDFGSLGLNAFQCVGGDEVSCAGVLASAVDVVSGPSVVADAAGVRALATKTRSPTMTSGAPAVAPVETSLTPGSKFVAGGSPEKASSGSQEAGKAIFKHRPPPDATGPATKHVTVEIVGKDGKSLGEWHQTYGRKVSAIEPVAPDVGAVKGKYEVPLENPEAASQHAEWMGTEKWPKWNEVDNNCIQKACEIANMGGAGLPQKPEEQTKYILEKIKSLGK